jgi:hypothetical protein
MSGQGTIQGLSETGDRFLSSVISGGGRRETIVRAIAEKPRCATNPPIESLMPPISPPVRNFFVDVAQAGNVYAVGTLARAKKKLPISRWEEFRTLFLIVAVTVVPVGGTVLAVWASTQRNLSGLTPVGNPQEQYSLLNWSSLGQHRPRNQAVQVLGYMADGDRPLREGEWVHDFFLLAEAGNLLHPAHRFGDHMIAVHLENDARVQFSSRSLVWAWGIFREVAGDPAGPTPLYSIEQAGARSADKSEIGKYFK